MTRPDELQQAERFLSEGKTGEAERLCKAVLKRAPRNGRALYLMGMAECLREKYGKGIEWLGKARRALPDDPDILYNLGKAYSLTKREAEAADCYRAVLAKVPDQPSALNNLGMVLIDTGRTEEGITCLRRVLECDPLSLLTPVNLMTAECQHLPPPAWIAVCNRTLAWASLAPEERYIALVQRAMAEWITGDMTALADTLQQAAETRPASPQSRSLHFTRYENFLNALLSYRQENSAFYTGAGEDIFLAGDSHCLSYANICTDSGIIRSRLIVGAKAWHSSQGKPNQYSAALDTLIAGMPEGARLFCTFGEIDCRKDEGILPYARKKGLSPAKIAAEQASRYVDAMAARAVKRKLRLSFLAVPPPHRDGFGVPEIVASFNHSLAARAAEMGYGYVDLYTPALDKRADGYARPDVHLDMVHFKGKALRERVRL